MFERYLSEALASHCRHIIKDFDADKVKFSVWNGEVILQDLTLKEDAIQQLKGGSDLPFKISYGHIGTFELRIPWNLLRLSKRTRKGENIVENSSCSVILSDVNILISPGLSQKVDDNQKDVDPQEERIKKERQVQNILDEALFRNNIELVAKDDANTKKSFVKELIRNVISSLSVTVRNVHIRYEDPGDGLGFEKKDRFNFRHKSKHRPPFSVGITLKEFCFGSAEKGPKKDEELYHIPEVDELSVEHDLPESNTETELYSVQHKLAMAQDLSIYWDSDISSNELIHIYVKKIQRRNKREFRRNEHLGISHHSSDEDEPENLLENNESSDAETVPEAKNDLFSTLLNKSLHSQEQDSKRTYIIQPISPSLQCSVVNAIQSKSSDESSKPVLPPSRAVLTLPASQMNITKDTLEDIAYFRRSFELWKEMRTSLLTRKIYAELTRARPAVSPLEDPKAWWQYAFEAVKTLSRIENGEKKTREKKGWLGLVKSLKAKKEYLSMHKSLLNPNTSLHEKEECNRKLCILEDTLQPTEIVAFRVDTLSDIMNAANRHEDLSIDEEGVCEGSYWWMRRKNQSVDAEPKDNLQHAIFDEKDLLTVLYRQKICAEMMVILQIEEDLTCGALQFKSAGLFSLKQNVDTRSKLEITILSHQIILQIDDIVSDRASFSHTPRVSHRHPVAQLRCASVQKLRYHQNSMWDITSTFASLEVLDLMDSHSSLSICPRLVTRKREWISQVPTSDISEDLSDKAVIIGGISHPHGGTICVQKRVSSKMNASEAPGATSDVILSINIKMSPMEIVYSPETVQTLSKVLSTTKTSELTVDYQRLKRVISNWKAQQKQRLIEALSRTGRKVLLNLNIAAPVFLMHDKTSNGTLVVDLGRLTVRNEDEVSKGYDDTWKLSLQDIQVLSMPRPNDVSSTIYDLVHYRDTCQLVEPFSLEFMISTRFVDQDSNGLASQVLIDATLPRLVLNFSSSAIRLVHRLSTYRKIRKLRSKPQIDQSEGKEVSQAKVSSLPHSSIQYQDNHDERKRTAINFKFSAPLIAMRLVNDVDGRDCTESSFIDSKKTQIVEVVIRGIRGELCRTFIDGRINNTEFNARLRSLIAEDLYQQAGREFSLLLSSQNPLSQLSDHDMDSDLVCVKFDDISSKNSEGRQKSLSIVFHELYVEWNPETLAAIQKSLRLSLKEKDFFAELNENTDCHSPDSPPDAISPYSLKISKTQSVDESVAFFDAVEEERAAMSDEDVFLSEFSSDAERNEDDIYFYQDRVPSPILSPIVVKAMKASIRKSHLYDNLDLLLQQSCAKGAPDDPPRRKLPSITFAAKFQLSKLRVRFNKETRLRRLVVAEMNETLIQYRSKPFGGARTVANFGNFTLLDPSKYDGSTLYGEILGLKTGADRSESMLKITHETFPREDKSAEDRAMPNNIKEVENIDAICRDEISVSIDSSKRCIVGCDTFISMHFSPMRFVLLQQLWMEIADYFFEGIVGYEVWGRIRPGKNSAVDEQQRQVEEEIMSSQERDCTDETIYGADGKKVKFLRFQIKMDSPVIILPVAYRSPQHLRFDLDGIHIENRYNGTVECLGQSLEEPSRYVQWYNNCNIDFEGLRLNSWCGTQLNVNQDPKVPSKKDGENRIPMKISVRWPVGPTNFTIVPKWNIRCSIDNLRLLFRKNDFALFQHIVWYNIGEESRHLDEWNALQNLPPERLKSYKDKMMVHFGYDKKDGPPTTFHFKVDIASVIFHFCVDENEHVADVEGSALSWSLRKVKDRISRQILTFKSIHLCQTSGNEAWAGYQQLLFPLKNVRKKGEQKSQLVYRSTSKPSGDVVKLLMVNDACIYFIYPAWMFVKVFFQNLPEPDLMNHEEVLSSIQIADRWYRIGSNANNPEELNAKYRGSERRPVQKTNMADFQFRIILKAPRIVLVDNSCGDHGVCKKGRSVTLRLSHLDFLYHSYQKASFLEKTVFLHDLEVFTASNGTVSGSGDNQQRSLLYPLCAGAGIISQYQNDVLVQSKKWLSSDVVSFRAAYTDMTLAIEIFQKILSDYHDVQDQIIVTGADSQKAKLDSSKTTPNTEGDVYRVKESFSVACGGIDLLVIDDSGRHFARAQELVQLSISGILYKTSKFPDCEDTLSVMRLQFHGIELSDCLQPLNSPFRIVAVGNNLHIDESDTTPFESKSDKKCRWSNMNKKIFTDFMSWETYSMVESKNGSYELSSSMSGRRALAFKSEMRNPFKDFNLIDILHKIPFPNRHEYKCAVREIVLQWNPSMAIALQRFLGRLRKDVKKKELASRVNTHQQASSHPDETEPSKYQSAEIEIEAVTLCLNKEHQHRRLLQITISEAFIAFQRNEFSRFTVQGTLGDLNAWDSDGNRDGQVPICQENRLVVGVLHDPADADANNSQAEFESQDKKGINNSQRLLVVNYYSMPTGIDRSKGLEDSFHDLELPSWVASQVGKEATIDNVDDCLSLSIATVRFNHIRERTGEIIDYLSNGLPGKGMGATSRAAKGFITKRIKNRSFANLVVNSPQLFLPRHRGKQEGVIVCLGDVRLKSWFDEATLDESRDVDCNDLLRARVRMDDKNLTTESSTGSDVNKKVWWRILSLTVLGLGWKVNQKKEEALENPLNFHLHVRKPSSITDLPVIIRCKMTTVELVLTYNEYMLLNAVLDENLTKKVDKSLWDNLEDPFANVEDQTSGVQYSKNARFVRYGKSSHRHSNQRDKSAVGVVPSESVVKSMTSLDIKFSLDGVVLVLHRDDIIPMIDKEITYDIVLLEVDDIDLRMVSNSDGRKSGTVKLHSFALRDVGDTGRIARERLLDEISTKENRCSPVQDHILRKPSVFSVIAEGYDTGNEENESTLSEQAKDPQLIITFDTGSSIVDEESFPHREDTKVTSVRVTLNHVNINPLIRPLREVADFVSGSWSLDNSNLEKEGYDVNKIGIVDVSELTQHTDAADDKPTSPNVSRAGSNRALHLTVVTNYPRVFLVPDETDPSTKALVLRGLTVFNATIVKKDGSEETSQSTTLSIQGQVHSLESYINPDPRYVLEELHRISSSKESEERDTATRGECNDALGVALIEPVTASFTLLQLQRSNFPTLREAFISMEPVSTTLSFEDMQLIEVVFSRWKKERDRVRLKVSALVGPSIRNYLDEYAASDSNDVLHYEFPEALEPAQHVRLSHDEHEIIMTASDSLDAEMNSTPLCGTCLRSDQLCMQNSNVRDSKNDLSTPATPLSFSIVFSDQKLGLALRKRESSVLVDQVLNAAIKEAIEIGDEVISIEGTLVSDIPFQAVLDLVYKTKRPMTVVFRRNRYKKEIDMVSSEESPSISLPNEELKFHNESGSAEKYLPKALQESSSLNEAKNKISRRTYSVSLKCGVESGIQIERSMCGNVAVVSNICISTYIYSCVTQTNKHMPRPGSIIIAINNQGVVEKGFKITSDLLQNYMDEEIDIEKSYTITFLDATADDWGAIDKVDIVVAGIKLTIIDDINGRDMPLLRGTLRSVAFKMERGVGLDCNSIQIRPPSILMVGETMKDEIPVKSDLTEIVTKMCASAELQLDYYNARIAVWEPLVESSCLCAELESQKANQCVDRPRPGALSLAISDYLGSDLIDVVKQPYVCINVTDTAADLLFTAFHEWKVWRKNLGQDMQLVAQNQLVVPQTHIRSSETCSPHVSQSGSKSQNDDNVNRFILPRRGQHHIGDSIQNAGAAQNAAQAALIFARRRGVDHQKSEDSKPFIFRNRTGMTISFLPEVLNVDDTDKNEDGVRTMFNLSKKVAVTTIQDGQESKFDLETTQNYEGSESYVKHGNKVRSYDGQFPLLSVNFHTADKNTRVEILQHMSVVRIGQTMKSLIVRSSTKIDEKETAFILVLWSVALENNRRIITLSSAVRVSSRLCGIPIEVGVRQNDNEDLKLIGISSSSNVCFLPLWLQLSFKPAKIYVRPQSRSSSFKWSNLGIMYLQKLAIGNSGSHLWTWTLSNEATNIKCEATSDSRHPSALLSYECIYEIPSLATYISGDVFLPDYPDHEYHIKCVDICSTLSLRNILPVTLQWKIVQVDASNRIATEIVKDGSSMHRDDTWAVPIDELESQHFNEEVHVAILPGHAIDIFSSDIATMNIGLRIRCESDDEWSACVPINYVINEDNFSRLPLVESDEKDQQLPKCQSGCLFNKRTASAQSSNKLGPPVTFGIQMNPRLATVSKNGKSVEVVIGFDLVVFSEIWIKNLTSLPILFGVPSRQIDFSSSDSASLNSIHEPVRKKAAEAALLELSSILEFGDKGHRPGDQKKEILSLSKQECKTAVEEVFEYKEVDNGKTVRHWWAGEYHGHEMPKVTSLGSLEDTEWVWKDKAWNLDSTGGCKASQGCWESASNLTSDRDTSFSPQRFFNPAHRFKRRRWFRFKENIYQSAEASEDMVVCFHQPTIEISSQSKDDEHSSNDKRNSDIEPESDDDNPLMFYFKINDSRWSSPALVPSNGPAHGILRIPAARWPALVKSKEKITEPTFYGNSLSAGFPGLSTVKFNAGSLSSKAFDVCYRVTPIEGQWGDHSRILVLYPRFFIRNDSKECYMDIKQSGATDKSSIRVKPGSSEPFYWTDTSLPELLCIRPIMKNRNRSIHRWSGGFDITSLGMIPLMIQKNSGVRNDIDVQTPKSIDVVQALIELRPGTGGTGLSISIKEELENGEDSLYRLENHSPFPLWIMQDGLSANPIRQDMRSPMDSNTIVLDPGVTTPYGLVNPFRQGKYAGRKAVPLDELLRLRIGLAPLATRDGIESTKVVNLSHVGTDVRLKPAKLRTFFDEETIDDLMKVNVRGIVVSDGPTRVLKFTLIQRDRTASSVIKNSVRMHTDVLSNEVKHHTDLLIKLQRAADRTTFLLKSQKLQKYDRRENYNNFVNSEKPTPEVFAGHNDCNYSFRGSLKGFVISLVDKFPSEVGIITVRNIHAMSEWNAHRTREATAALSVGWMQIDNHCPNAPFPVVLCPTPPKDDIETSTEIDTDENDSPFLTIGIVLAPRHKSGIICLEGVTISLSDISFMTDLAFVLRVQYQLLGILSHFERHKEKHDVEKQSDYFIKDICHFPDFSTIFSLRHASDKKKIASKKLYFEGLTILPFTIKLSIASSVALTSAQAALEGMEAGAIHAAVRKGDLLIGDKANGVVGVKIGSKNRTAMAVIRGIFKSILVDSLLRCDDVSMNFSGLAVRYHLSTMPQLKTYIGHHYLSLLKSNVPALIGSLAAFGNPVGLIRGFGDGVTDFVSEPIKGFKRSVEELDPSYVMDGVARGTGSLARHTVGGIVDSASLLTETFSKNMAVLTLDRKYAQRRDRFKVMPGTNTTFVGGVESGVGKLLRGVAEGVIGVVRAPMRGAEKRGVEGFAKGVGKGLLGLVVKPVIGISDAATDVMVGVKGTLEGVGSKSQKILSKQAQVRPRRAFYGRDRRLKSYVFVDAISSAIMMRTRLGGDNYLSHIDMGGPVAILSIRRFLLLGDDGETKMLLRLKHIKRIDLKKVPTSNGGIEWGVLIFMKTVRNNGNEVEVVTTPDKDTAKDICTKIQHGISLLE